MDFGVANATGLTRMQNYSLEHRTSSEVMACQKMKYLQISNIQPEKLKPTELKKKVKKS